MAWHESKWKVIVAEEDRSDLERFLAKHGLKVRRWVNYVPDFEDENPDWEAVCELADTWHRGRSDPPVSSDSEPPQFVQDKPKAAKKTTKKATKARPKP